MIKDLFFVLIDCWSICFFTFCPKYIMISIYLVLIRLLYCRATVKLNQNKIYTTHNITSHVGLVAPLIYKHYQTDMQTLSKYYRHVCVYDSI